MILCLLISSVLTLGHWTTKTYKVYICVSSPHYWTYLCGLDQFFILYLVCIYAYWYFVTQTSPKGFTAGSILVKGKPTWSQNMGLNPCPSGQQSVVLITGRVPTKPGKIKEFSPTSCKLWHIRNISTNTRKFLRNSWKN